MSRSKLLKNILWLFFDKIVRILGGLIIGIWVARYLAPENFGVLNYAIAYTSFFVIFVKLGLDQIIVREIVKKPEESGSFLGTAFVLKLLGSIIAITSIYISLCLVKTDVSTRTVILIVAAGFIFQSLDVIDYYYQAKILSKYVVIARNSAFILISLLKIYFILHRYTVLYFCLASSAYAALSGIFLLFIYRKTENHIKTWRFSKKIASELIRFSWPLAISSFLISVHMRIDQVMIGNMLNTSEVGIYSVAVRLAESWMFVPGILVSTLMPYFVSIRENNTKLYNSRLIQLYSLMFWMGAIVGIGTIIFGKSVINFLYGQAYIEAYKALVINIWNGIFISQAIARGIWMISENLQKYRLYNNIIAVILNISTNIILIPRIGITGAAIATLATQAFGTWVFSFLWKPLRESTWGMIKSINPLYIIQIRQKI